MLTSRLNLFKVFSFSEKICHSTFCAVRGRSLPVLPGRNKFHRCCIRVYSSLDTKPLSVDEFKGDVHVKAETRSNDYLNGLDPKEIVGDDESLLKKLKVILLEIDVMRQDGQMVPDKISVDRWKELLIAPTRSQRIKLLGFLFRNQKKKENDLKKKEEKKKARELKMEQTANDKNSNPHINYGFGGSTIFLRIYDTKIDEMLNRKLITAMQFGQNLVLDCSYDNHMTPREASLCAKQMTYLFSENRKHDDPFNLHFCNAQKDMKTMKKLEILIPTLYDDTFPLNITSKSYLDIFPKDKLVYLTPHCREEMTTFSHDDIYIIGGMVDKVVTEHLSLGIAKREGLRMAKLPLDRHLLWHLGSKSLTLNQVLLILLEMKKSGNWTKALEHVPRRKLLQPDDELKFTPKKGPSLYRQRLKEFIKF